VIAFAGASFHVSQLIEESNGRRKRRKNFFKILEFPSIDTKGEPVVSKPPLGQWKMPNGYALGYYDVPTKFLYKSSLGAST
jgi:hypothetical protein